MIKLQHYPALFIALVFLLLPLKLEAQNTTASTTPIEINDAETGQPGHAGRGVQSTAPIMINNAVDLGKIGREYPLGVTYQQTADIVVNNHMPIGRFDFWGFTGEYDGQCHTI